LKVFLKPIIISLS